MGNSTAMYLAFSARSAHMSGERRAGTWKLTVITCAQQHQHSASAGVPGAFEVCAEGMLLACCDAATLSIPSSQPGTKMHKNAPLRRRMASTRFQTVESSMAEERSITLI